MLRGGQVISVLKRSLAAFFPALLEQITPGRISLLLWCQGDLAPPAWF
jgi:hypothetical protein